MLNLLVGSPYVLKLCSSRKRIKTYFYLFRISMIFVAFQLKICCEERFVPSDSRFEKVLPKSTIEIIVFSN